MDRTWQVLLLGGASGVGKTSVSYRLAAHYGIGITEVDDLYVAVRRLTTHAEQPALHEAGLEGDMLARMLRVSQALAPAVDAVIASHLESRTPVLLEGDFLLPGAALQPADVVALFLYEEDEGQIARNYRAREGQDQPRRAQASWRHSEWLRAECARLGVPTLAARPWESLLARCIARIDGA
ncbi:MAG TPA: hypothetical protein VNM16_05715 [Bacillota bacterium]|nr:hypothetical protein [Bacillota bacterium]